MLTIITVEMIYYFVQHFTLYHLKIYCSLIMEKNNKDV